MTVIYPSPIFGPVHSRRLGVSLGINLLPADGKVCSFDCIYCECGFNADHRSHSALPTREEVRSALESKLQDMSKSIKGTQTEKNLLRSFAGESQARMRYTYFASVAKKEGYEQISAIFTETAEQEKEHVAPNER